MIKAGQIALLFFERNGVGGLVYMGSTRSLGHKGF